MKSNNTFKYVNDGCDAKSARTLEELFGVKKELNLPYKRLADLEQGLKAMNLVDMQSLAVKMGIKPCAERQRLMRACVDQFTRLTKTYGYAKEPAKDVAPLIDFSKI